MKTQLIQLACWLAALLLLPLAAAQADTISVAAPAGVGAVVVASDGQCSLGEAMLLGNFAQANSDCVALADGNSGLTISLPAGASFTLTDGPFDADGPNGLPDVTGTYAIEGHGAAITRSTAAGTPRFRLLHVASNGHLTLDELTLSHGYTPDGFDGGYGDPGGDGGGIYNAGTLTITGSTVSANTTGDGGDSGEDDGGDAGYGGGIYNAGTLTITGSTVSANTTGDGGDNSGFVGMHGGFGGFGGGIYTYDGSRLTMTSSTVSDNTTGAGGLGGSGGSGGGIASDIHSNGKLTITHSTIRGNNAAGIGGGIFSDGVMTMVGSAIIGNAAPDGSALYVSGDQQSIINTTIASDGADGDPAILAQGDAHLTLVYVTVDAANTAIKADSPASTITLGHSVLEAANSDACAGGVGSIASLGYNVVNDSSCGFGGLGDQNGVLPLLADAPADNGGPTLSLLPQPGSPLIDAIPLADCALGVPAGVDASIDQRGAPRPQGGGCDIGAVERIVDVSLRGLGQNGQSALVGQAFAQPLVVQALQAVGALAGLVPVVQVPASGASANCTSEPTNATGIARIECTANAIAGSYVVQIRIPFGPYVSPFGVTYTLTNLPSDRIFGSGFEGAALPPIGVSP